MEEREQLRKRILAGRSGLNGKTVMEHSRQICEFLEQIPRLAAARVVMAYAPVKNEVDTTYFWTETPFNERIIVLPRVEGEDLAAVKFTGWENTVISRVGIREPVGEPYPVRDIQAVLVPGVVFDRNGYRLGYGRGFYDRFLPLLNPSAVLIGTAYELQIAMDTYPRKHDVKVHYLVTEKGITVIDQ